LMLAPEDPERGLQNAKEARSSPTSLYLLTESVDKVVAKAVSLGAAAKGEVADMFWGDRCGAVVDPDGYTWTVATHIANPTPEEMKKKLKEQMRAQTAGPGKGRDSSADEVPPKTGANRKKPKK
jgi:PhnB protein